MIDELAKRKIVRLYKEGMPVKQIVLEMGLSFNVIMLFISRVRAKEQLSYRKVPLTPNEIKALLILYKAGFTFVDIGKQLGCNPQVLVAYIKRLREKHILSSRVIPRPKNWRGDK